jgi:hypothetical protein
MLGANSNSAPRLAPHLLVGAWPPGPHHAPPPPGRRRRRQTKTGTVPRSRMCPAGGPAAAPRARLRRRPAPPAHPGYRPKSAKPPGVSVGARREAAAACVWQSGLGKARGPGVGRQTSGRETCSPPPVTSVEGRHECWSRGCRGQGATSPMGQRKGGMGCRVCVLSPPPIPCAAIRPTGGAARSFELHTQQTLSGVSPQSALVCAHWCARAPSAAAPASDLSRAVSARSFILREQSQLLCRSEISLAPTQFSRARATHRGARCASRPPAAWASAKGRQAARGGKERKGLKDAVRAS